MQASSKLIQNKLIESPLVMVVMTPLIKMALLMLGVVLDGGGGDDTGGGREVQCHVDRKQGSGSPCLRTVSHAYRLPPSALS